MSRRRDLLAGVFSPPHVDTLPDDREPAAVLPAALGAMRSSLRELAVEADRARLLEEQIEAGDRVVDLDPRLVDASFIRDRIPVSDDPEFEAFVASMESGQQVPILVRPHPEQAGRYQAAFGHRRLRAAERLGRNVRAVVRELTDAELVIAQGKENSDRRDLSFIERALFALSLQERGFDRSTAMSALSVDKGDLSRLLAVAKAIPVDIILAVGPAPKVGRARWMQFADAFQKPGAKKMAEKAIRQNSFRSSDTNSRIDVLIAALQPRSSAAPTKICFTPDGKAIGRIERGARSVRFATDDLAFGSYLAEAMPRIYAEFVAYAGPLELETGGVEGQPEDR